MAYCRPPDLSHETIARLTVQLFPFSEVEKDATKQFPGYDDRNFYFRGKLESGNSPEEFILKLSNSSTTYELTEGTNEVMEYLKSKEFCCPYPFPSRNGAEIEVLSEGQLLKGDPSAKVGRRPKFCIRVLAYIPGEIMVRVDRNPQLLYNVGSYIGSLDAALQEFRHPAIDNRQFLERGWDLKYFDLKKYLPSIRDPKRRKMVETVLRGFKTHVAPKIPSMKCGTIHGDASIQNIIVDRVEEPKIAGIIDFGDCMNTCYVFELVAMLADAMMEQKDPVLYVCPMLCGYLHAFPLSDEELDCLYHLVLARLCQLAVVSESQFQEEPWNTYLQGIVAAAWPLTEELLATSKEEVDRVWTEARKKNAADFKL